MWFKTIFRRQTNTKEAPIFDEAFLRRMERLGLQAQRTLRGRPASGEHQSRQQIASPIFSEHRPYTTGDDLRYVDWNAYARQEHVLVKLGETEQDIDVHIMLDYSASMRWGKPSKLWVAQRLGGAIGYLALAHSDRLRLSYFNGDTLQSFGPVQGKSRIADMLNFINTTAGNAKQTQKQTSATQIVKLVQRYARQHPRGGLLVLCSDLLLSDGLAEALQALPPPRWQVVVVHLLDPEEIAPSLQGPIELEDNETAQRLALTIDSLSLETYDKNLRTWQERIAQSCARRGATYARLLTTWPLEKQIIPYLRLRRILT